MNRRAALADAVEAYRLPRLVRLTGNTYAAVFSLMKLLPADHILRAATLRGDVRPDTTIVETTSGTFGLGLAMRTALTGNPLVLVSDPVIDDRLRERLELLGARVDIVRDPSPVGGYQAARLDRVAQVRAEIADTFCPNQYSNPDNPLAYALAAEAVAEAVGQVDCLVGPVGSGGSMCGTANNLRTAFPEMRAIGVDTHLSVLFGQPDGHRRLRGLGNSLMPANLDHRTFDEVHWVGAAEAYQATRELFRRHALFTGPTSGAAYLVGRWFAERNPDATTVIMCPDDGYRYQDTVYHAGWLAENHLLDRGEREPTPVADPTRGTSGWAFLPWQRRSLDEVLRNEPAPVSAELRGGRRTWR
ncbi:pyridoxal-phosphate dependent enzyme [Goodfellowiella coeruleoviolacea]|uniref:Cysteine synthase A n=1 Tax=Goodfellowiella coeruleoviolacea TaxID=334858 RepID=A0AAE3GGH2_9PSEU|nr:pyridoxal-phosphate dependent enzyme [Goodfellowiella coeruleoviolacea]MCP2167695.1 cysteine synthase A [Goodfellowiella coeruleoviolacea]